MKEPELKSRQFKGLKFSLVQRLREITDIGYNEKKMYQAICLSNTEVFI